MKKQTLNQEHITRLIILAECFEKLNRDFPSPHLYENDLPYRLFRSKVIFSCFPFTYSELPHLFPQH